MITSFVEDTIDPADIANDARVDDLGQESFFRCTIIILGDLQLDIILNLLSQSLNLPWGEKQLLVFRK